MFRLMCIALVAVATLSSQALAGGGGAKKDATIRVTNDIPSSAFARVGVILDKTPAQLNTIATSANPEQAFINAGGKFLTAGQAASFSVQAGDHTIIVVSADTATPSAIASTSKSVGRGQTLNLNTSSL